MKHPIIIIILLTMLISSCGNKHQSAEIGPSLVTDRSTNSYFTQEEFEWFLITPDGVPLYVLEAGRGEKVIALHGGFGMEHSYMRSFLRPFETDYHMVYYDQRGSLRSPVPDHDFEEYVTMDNMVNDLDLLRRELGEEKITLLAHSMGAVLAYEYMRKYPEKVGNVIIISGFIPKFPASKAEFNDMFLSQKERAEFSNRPAVLQELEKLKATTDTTSRAYTYLNWKIQYASCQIYNIENWPEVEGGLGFFNGKLNEIIGPESNIPWLYAWRFYRYQRQFDKETLDASDAAAGGESPINYLPEIKNHDYRVSYLLGRYEGGDFNLRLYNRYLSDVENAELHIFEEACHNIWMDQPEEFAQVLGACLEKSTNSGLASKEEQAK